PAVEVPVRRDLACALRSFETDLFPVAGGNEEINLKRRRQELHGFLFALESLNLAPRVKDHAWLKVLVATNPHFPVRLGGMRLGNQFSRRLERIQCPPAAREYGPNKERRCSNQHRNQSLAPLPCQTAPGAQRAEYKR